MRQISISTDVFALIWASRADGEESEDDILRRLLSRSSLPVGVGAPLPSVGFSDPRYGVSLPEGFRIFRNYKGTRFEAAARGGEWWIDGCEGSLRSLNELSRAIGAGSENAWLNWFYLDEDGTRSPIARLRRVGVQIRDRPARTSGSSWREDVHAALTALGGEASLAEIYNEVRDIRSNNGRSLPRHLEAIVRRTLEENCPGTKSYRGKESIFRAPKGLGAGVWALKTVGRS